MGSKSGTPRITINVGGVPVVICGGGLKGNKLVGTSLRINSNSVCKSIPKTNKGRGARRKGRIRGPLLAVGINFEVVDGKWKLTSESEKKIPLFATYTENVCGEGRVVKQIKNAWHTSNVYPSSLIVCINEFLKENDIPLP